MTFTKAERLFLKEKKIKKDFKNKLEEGGISFCYPEWNNIFGEFINDLEACFLLKQQLIEENKLLNNVSKTNKNKKTK